MSNLLFEDAPHWEVGRRHVLLPEPTASAPALFVPSNAKFRSLQVLSWAGTVPALRHGGKTIHLLPTACQRHTQSPLKKAARSSTGRLRVCQVTPGWSNDAIKAPRSPTQTSPPASPTQPCPPPSGTRNSIPITYVIMMENSHGYFHPGHRHRYPAPNRL